MSDVPMCIEGSQLEGGGQVVRVAMACSAVNRRTTTVTNVRAGRPNPASRRSTSRASSSWRCATARSEPGRSFRRTRGERGTAASEEGCVEFTTSSRAGSSTNPMTRRHARQTPDARHVQLKVHASTMPRNRRGRGHRGSVALVLRRRCRGSSGPTTGDGDGDGTGTKSRREHRADRLADAERGTTPVRADGLRPTAVAGRLREREPSRLRVRRGRDVRSA